MIAWPTCRVACSAAWNSRPSTVDGSPARPTFRVVEQRPAGVDAQLLERALDASAAPRATTAREGRRRLAGIPFRLAQGALRVLSASPRA